MMIGDKNTGNVGSDISALKGFGEAYTNEDEK